MLDRMTPVVKNLVIINVLVFLAQQAFPQLQFWFMGHYPLSPDFYPWQMVTYMFMHGGFTHILFNMFAHSVRNNLVSDKKSIFET